MFEPEFDREQLREFNKKGYRSVAARYAQSAELMLIKLEDEIEQLREYYEASQAVEEGVVSFELHADAVERLRKATEALRGE